MVAGSKKLKSPSLSKTGFAKRICRKAVSLLFITVPSDDLVSDANVLCSGTSTTSGTLKLVGWFVLVATNLSTSLLILSNGLVESFLFLNTIFNGKKYNQKKDTIGCFFGRGRFYTVVVTLCLFTIMLLGSIKFHFIIRKALYISFLATCLTTTSSFLFLCFLTCLTCLSCFSCFTFAISRRIRLRECYKQFPY